MNLGRLPFANLRARLGTTVGLAVLVALLSLIACGGALVMSCMQNGLDSLGARLGADVVVAPKTAKSKVDLEEVLVEGVPGSFYMDGAKVGEVAAREGVERASAQYYLATVKAGCCSMPVQVVGFDPATDFSITPWIARTYGDGLGLDDVAVGCNITGAPGATIMLYGVECTIVSKLEETGTSLDNSVFATNETLRHLIGGSKRQGLAVLEERDPAEVVSTVQVKVADGYDPEQVAGDINLHVRGVWAVSTRAMTSGVADGVAGAARLTGVVMAVLWVLAAALLVAAFAIAGRGRTREFAVLRTVGASRAALMRVVLVEALVVSAVGAAVGVAVAVFAVTGFNATIESALGLPFLMPDAAKVAGYAAAVFATTVIVGSAASVASARRLSKVDAGQTLREE